ncbi:histidine phosphatase family protein [Nakamurella silvestris]|nr:histidine phosphatase family protein [Nakamurella silvestris]
MPEQLADTEHRGEDRPADAGVPEGRTDDLTTLVVVRHAETTWGAQGRFAGRADIGLSAHGLRQLGPLAERIAPLAPAVVIHSPLSRCRLTAEAIAELAGCRTLVDEGITDGALGEWSGHSAVQIADRWPAEFAAWRSDVDAAPPGGESFNEIRERMTKAVRRIVRAHRGETVVLVTHAAPSKMLFAWSLDADSAVAYQMRIDNASLTIIELVNGSGPVLITANDTAHLAPIAPPTVDPAT